MKLAVIPARGGSKRIPRKNIKPFHGKPMIAWSIEAALNSQCFDRVIVSTDDPEITAIAIEYGAEVPFIRPSELSDDYTGTLPVMRHAVDWMASNIAPVDYACCIYATAPFIRVEDLRAGWEKISGQLCSYAFTVTGYGFPIQRALRLEPNGRVSMFYPEQYATRSQDLEEAFHDAGQFYWGTSTAWLSEKNVFSRDSVPIVLPRYRVQDIDTPEDWVRAEWLFRSIIENPDNS